MLLETLLHNMQRYLQGEESLKVFEAWLIPATWDLKRQGDVLAYIVCGTLELDLAEHSSGHLDEDELKREWTALVNAFKQLCGTTTTSANCIITMDAQPANTVDLVFAVPA